jgi:hypothetical protein
LRSSANILRAGRTDYIKHRIYAKRRNILVAKTKGKSPLGRSRCRWENNYKMYLRELGYEADDWIYLAQDLAVVDNVMNSRIP